MTGPVNASLRFSQPGRVRTKSVRYTTIFSMEFLDLKIKLAFALNRLCLTIYRRVIAAKKRAGIPGPVGATSGNRR